MGENHTRGGRGLLVLLARLGSTVQVEKKRKEKERESHSGS